MARIKEIFTAELEKLQVTENGEIVRIWGILPEKDRDIVIRLSLDKAEEFANGILATVAKGREIIEREKNKEFYLYQELKKKFEATEAEKPVVTE